MRDFVHLHLHSEYSLLDGVCRIADIPRYAKQQGHTAVALTDHGVMYGAVAFFRACQAEGIKPIIGCEMYVAEHSRFDRIPREHDHYHLVLLIENETGYRNLIYLVSKSYTEGFYGKPRTDLESLKDHAEGLIALSACAGGYIPQRIMAGRTEEARSHAQTLAGIFGRDHFYLELQDHGNDYDAAVNRGLALISAETGIGLVATNDVHYLKKEDASLQEILLCIQTKSVITDGRPVGFETDEYYYKSTDEMAALFSSYSGALENTVKIADMCDFSFDFSHTHTPTFLLPEGVTGGEYLRRQTMQGLARRIMNGDIRYENEGDEDIYRERIEYELSVIDSMGYSEYFLIVSDFVNFARRTGIPTGPGRGSGAGSLVAYLIRITDIDPVKFNLLFEAFLNPERVSMPDFDIDFCYERRGEVIDYVTEKYGAERVSQIVTFGTLASRAVVLDTGRALGLPFGTTEAIAKMISQKETLSEAMARPELKKRYESDPQIKKLLDLSLALEGMPRNTSIHAAGVVITDRPLHEYVPLAVRGDVQVTQYDMDTIAALGLLKFDFLALRYLTIIADTEHQIREFEPTFQIEKIPLDDSETFAQLSRGNTVGLFQLESAGMRRMLSEFRPQSIEDIMLALAMYRPGPMDAVPKLIENRRRQKAGETLSYPAPELADILDETGGCIVYQEQVMQIFRTLAGYSYGKADIVRRAIAKKKAGVIEQERDHFIAGAESRGMTREAAQTLFESMIDFSNYGFKKSHAAAYSVLSYRTAYLKTHYPSCYLASLLTSVLDNTPKMSDYMNECDRLGIAILPPDVNESFTQFHVASDGASIRFGLLGLKNLGEAFVGSLIEQRCMGRYTSFGDFIGRLAGCNINKRQIESLIKAGAFDGFGYPRRALFDVHEQVIDSIAERGRSNLSGQMDLFADPAASADTSSPEIRIPDDREEWSLKEKLTYEKEMAGFYFSGHRIDDYSSHAAALGSVPIREILSSFQEEADLPLYRDRQKITISGLITGQTTKTMRNGQPMKFVSLEDRTAQIEILVFSNLLEQVQPLLTVDRAIAVYGTISCRDEDNVTVLADRIVPLADNTAYAAMPHDREQPCQTTAPSSTAKSADQAKAEPSSAKNVKLYVKVPDCESAIFQKVQNLADIFDGFVPLILFDESARRYLKRQGGIVVNDTVLRELKEIAGEDAVVLRSGE